MNIFPTRKTITKFPDKIQSSNLEPVIFSQQSYLSMHEQLLKSYLKIEQRIETTAHTKISTKVDTMDCVKSDVHRINTVLMNGKSYELFVYEVDQSKSLNDHIDYVHSQNLRLVFDCDVIKEVDETGKLGDTCFKKFVKSIFFLGEPPNFCNIWLFGQKNSMICQCTYIQFSEDEDYLDVITDVIIDPYSKLGEKSVYDSVDCDKPGEKLYFLVFK